MNVNFLIYFAMSLFLSLKALAVPPICTEYFRMAGNGKHSLTSSLFGVYVKQKGHSTDEKVWSMWCKDNRVVRQYHDAVDGSNQYIFKIKCIWPY